MYWLYEQFQWIGDAIAREKQISRFKTKNKFINPTEDLFEEKKI
jgi:hypothetical protein